jgi:hypothetical protein
VAVDQHELGNLVVDVEQTPDVPVEPEGDRVLLVAARAVTGYSPCDLMTSTTSAVGMNPYRSEVFTGWRSVWLTVESFVSSMI